jgi:dTDP-4-dehydrorhamnose reductase
VTAWALFGSFDWDSLLTRDRGRYEPGVFDVRGPAPRPTILARAVQALARGERFDHPVLAAPGWWSAARAATPVARDWVAA